MLCYVMYTDQPIPNGYKKQLMVDFFTVQLASKLASVGLDVDEMIWQLCVDGDLAGLFSCHFLCGWFRYDWSKSRYPHC